MNNIKVSVIVPVYNVRKYLNRCLNSILEQNFSKFEIIIVDDGSTDGSEKIVDEYNKKYDFVTVIHKENEGLGFARNTGLKYARGEYVLFIDSDDYIDKNMLSNLYPAIKKENADVCYSDFYRDYGSKIQKNDHLKGLSGTYRGEEIKSKIVPWMIGGAPQDKYDDILGWGVWKSLYSRKVIEKHNIEFHSEKEMISEDIIFQLDFLKYTTCVVVIDAPFYHYCLRKGSLSAKYKPDRIEKNIYLYNQELKRIKDMNILSKVKKRADRLLIASARSNIMLSVEAQSVLKSFATIKQYGQNGVYAQVANEYPISKLPWKQKIFMYLFKNKMPFLLYCISYIYVKMFNKH